MRSLVAPHKFSGHSALSLTAKQFSDKEQSDGSTPSERTKHLSVSPRSLSSTAERFVYIEDVGGSNPSATTRKHSSMLKFGTKFKLNWLEDDSRGDGFYISELPF